MDFVVEDGSGDPEATSYVSVADAVEYATLHGLAFSASPDVGNEAALIRASAAIDARYATSYPGYRKSGREQGLHWPRAAAYDTQGWLIRDDEVPIEIVYATVEAAVRELASPGSMMPDLERGGGIQSVRAGSVLVTYQANASAQTTFTLIDNILSNILSTLSGSGGGLFGSTVRG